LIDPFNAISFVVSCCVLADRRPVLAQHGLSRCDASRQEWRGSKTEVTRSVDGAVRCAIGKVRGGDFSDV